MIKHLRNKLYFDASAAARTCRDARCDVRREGQTAIGGCPDSGGRRPRMPPRGCGFN